MNNTLHIKFIHIDDWNRPIFKVIEYKKYFLCDTDHLFNHNTTEKEIKNFYKKLLPLNKYLIYYGSSSNGEPSGENIEKELILI